MKLVYPTVEAWKQTSRVDHVAKCARVCYASESDNEDSNLRLVSSLEKKGHLSMFRHETKCFIVPRKDNPDWRGIYNELTKFIYCPFIAFVHANGTTFVSTNGQLWRDLEGHKIVERLSKYEVPIEHFQTTETGWGLMRYTFCLTTSIRVSRELNRVSPNNIAEQSTRYVDFGKKGGITICLPHWWLGSPWYIKTAFKTYWKMCEIAYKLALKVGFKPEDASGLLPLQTATKVVYTYNVNEWKHIIDLRYHGTTGKPHPDAKRVISLVRWYLQEEGYEL